MRGGKISIETSTGSKLYWSSDGTAEGELTPIDMMEDAERTLGDSLCGADAGGSLMPLRSSAGPLTSAITGLPLTSARTGAPLISARLV